MAEVFGLTGFFLALGAFMVACEALRQVSNEKDTYLNAFTERLAAARRETDERIEAIEKRLTESKAESGKLLAALEKRSRKDKGGRKARDFTPSDEI